MLVLLESALEWKKGLTRSILTPFNYYYCYYYFSSFWPQVWLCNLVSSAHCARSCMFALQRPDDVMSRRSDWWSGSVPRGRPCLIRCCCQQLCSNCASMQDTGIYWIQGGDFSIRAQWNTFSAFLVALGATAKGGSRQYNDAWHNNPTVSQPVPRKPHNMCHCVPRFAAQPRCLALAGDTESPGSTVMLIAAGL